MSIDRQSPRRVPASASGRAAVLHFALLILGLAAAGCDRAAPPATGGEVDRPDRAASHLPAPQSPDLASGKRPIRVIVPRETPRSPFFLGLKAELKDGEACEIKMEVSSRIGGPTTVEFSLPEGAAIVEGERIQESTLEVGEVREFRVVVKVPPEGHQFVAAYATVNGRRGEAFVEFGEPPSAEQRGFRVRTRGAGDRVIRIGGEDAGK